MHNVRGGGEGGGSLPFYYAKFDPSPALRPTTMVLLSWVRNFILPHCLTGAGDPNTAWSKRQTLHLYVYPAQPSIFALLYFIPTCLPAGSAISP